VHGVDKTDTGDLGSTAAVTPAADCAVSASRSGSRSRGRSPAACAVSAVSFAVAAARARPARSGCVAPGRWSSPGPPVSQSLWIS
jgi:hypothetical protein